MTVQEVEGNFAVLKSILSNMADQDGLGDLEKQLVTTALDIAEGLAVNIAKIAEAVCK